MRGGEQKPDGLLGKRNAECVGKREKSDIVVSILPERFPRAVLAAFKNLHGTRKQPLPLQSLKSGVSPLGIVLEHVALTLGGIAEINIVLMGTERFALNQLRHKDLGVDGPADAQVALPLSRCAVIRRRSGQSYNGHVVSERVKQGLKRALPLAAQMVRLVETDGPDPHLANERGPARSAAFVGVRGGVKRLIGDRADRLASAKLIADIVRKSFPVRKKQFGKALTPLIPYRDSRREDQRRLPDTPDQLQPQNGLAAARRGDDMKMSVCNIPLGFVQDLLLVAAKAAAEGDAGKNVRHLCFLTKRLFFSLSRPEGEINRPRIRSRKEKYRIDFHFLF